MKPSSPIFAAALGSFLLACGSSTSTAGGVGMAGAGAKAAQDQSGAANAGGSDVAERGGSVGADQSGAANAGESGGPDRGGAASSGGVGGSSATGGRAGTETGGAGSGGCPAAPPVNGTSCIPPYTAANGFPTCSYGSDPRPRCRTEAVCQSATWQVSTSACTAPPLPATCPGTPPSASSACSDTTLSCWYGDGARCWCSGCSRGSPYPNCQIIDPPQLFCAPLVEGCPTVMPQAGSPCSTPGASCGPDCTLTITCTDGVWQWAVGMCPVCASPETPVATPDGERPIASLRAGDLVYSVDRDAIVAVPLLKVEHTSVARHRVVRVVLEGGRVLEISPGHPTADGRTFGDLIAGSQLDAEHSVSSAELVPYAYGATFDILPASSTGTYYAAGALIGSTLFDRPPSKSRAIGASE